MRGEFDEPEFEAAPRRPDTEFTLGSMSLVLLFVGLVVLCGLCFALGYSVGHHASVDPVNAQATTGDAPAVAPAESAHAKPAADAQPVIEKPAGKANAAVETSRVPVTPASKQWTAVKPALQGAQAAEAAQQPAESAVAPALGGSHMVQIAAVANAEDAEVLMSALKRHGYAVVSRREPLDGLIHVRIGPFASDEEAQKWRQRLLNDGYNAIVQP